MRGAIALGAAQGVHQAPLAGAIHGLAGSRAPAAAVLASLPDAVSRLAYIGLFGAGSVVSRRARR